MLGSGRNLQSFGMSDELLHAELTQSVIGAFYEVYNTLKHGLLESLYLTALERELRARGHRVSGELSVRVIYKGISVRRRSSTASYTKTI